MMDHPADIGLAFAFEIRARISVPHDGGPGRNGHRRIIPILDGTVAGPRLSGRVLPGADYELQRADGNSVVEAHYGIEASDGTPIYIRNKGLFVATPEVIARVDAGKRCHRQTIISARPLPSTPPKAHMPGCPTGSLCRRVVSHPAK